MRTLTLRGGLSYSIGNKVFLKDIPKTIDDDKIINKLINTNMFEENPPLCYHYIRRKQELPNQKTKRLVQIDNDWFSVSNSQPIKVTRYQWSKLSPSNQFEMVDPCDIMDAFVEEGKTDFSLLVIRDMGAGDIIIVTETLYNLRLNYPDAKIVFATSERYINLVNGLDFISEVIPISESDPASYDISVNLCGWSEVYPQCAKYHRSDIFGMAFSKKFNWIERKVSIYLEDENKEWFENINKINNPENLPTIALQPYGSSAHRSLNPVTINELADWFSTNGYFVYIYGEDQWPNVFPERPNVKVFWAEITLKQVVALIAGVSLLICPDSSGYHIASAFDTPSIPIFTTIHELVRVNYYKRCYPLRASELNCSPCWDTPCGIKSSCVRKMNSKRIMAKFFEVREQGFPEVIHLEYNPPDLGDKRNGRQNVR